jgi:uncharacterized protein YhaN
MKTLRACVSERQRDLASREREVEKATEADQGWNGAWAKTCSACWLREGGKLPTLATVREILAAITELGPVLEKKASLVDRAGKMEKDQTAFRHEAEALASAMGIAAISGDILDLARRSALVTESTDDENCYASCYTDSGRGDASDHIDPYPHTT